MHSHKTRATEFKVDAPSGAVAFYASAFGNVDAVGDRVIKGAFAKSLGSWRAKGDPVPIIFSHNWSDPHYIIGSADPHDVIEDDIGLKVMGKLDIETNEVARQVHSLMKRRIVKEASFAYDTLRERKGADGANELHELTLLEVGPTLKGANPATGDYPTAVKNLNAYLKSLATGDETNEQVIRELNFLQWEAGVTA